MLPSGRTTAALTRLSCPQATIVPRGCAATAVSKAAPDCDATLNEEVNVPSFFRKPTRTSSAPLRCQATANPSAVPAMEIVRASPGSMGPAVTWPEKSNSRSDGELRNPPAAAQRVLLQASLSIWTGSSTGGPEGL